MTRTAVLAPAISKEIRALLPLWGAAVATLAVTFLWRGRIPMDLGLLAYVGGSMAIGAHSIGQEYTHRTLPMLLSQPGDRRRLYLLKFVVLAVMLLTLAAFAWTVLVQTALRRDTPQFQVSFVVLPVLCGLFLAPLSTMICRSSLAGMMLSANVAGFAWMITLAIAWFGFGIDAEAAQTIILGRWTLAMVMLGPVVGFLGWRRFTALETTDVALPALHLPRWLASASGARHYAPLRALAAKEVHLQQLSFAIAGFFVVMWSVLSLLQRYVPTFSTFPVGAVLLLYCMGLAIMIGALASAEERQHGTLGWQLLQPTPAWQQWMVKVGVTLGLALLFGVGLPILLSQVSPHEGPQPIRISGDLMVLVVLLTASSVYISSLSSSGVWAMAWSVPVGIATAVFIQTVRGALRWATLTVGGPLMADVVTGAVTPSWATPGYVLLLAGRVFSLALVPLLLWFAFVNHTASERNARRILQQVALIAILIMAGLLLVGGVLASYELRSR